MSSSAIQLLVLAGIAVFLILKLRNVLGTREGYEKPVMPQDITPEQRRGGLEVIEGGPDRDITDHADEDSPAAEALYAMKRAEPDLNISEFLNGARGAYEMILMAFENGDLDPVRPFLSDDVYDTFAGVIEERERRGLTVEAEFIGVRELALVGADFDKATGEGEIRLRFVGEMTSVVRDQDGTIIEGDPGVIKRQKDIWTFARRIGADDPNWQLVATGE